MGNSPSESPNGEEAGQEDVCSGRKRRREESALENSPKATIPPPNSRARLDSSPEEGRFPSPPPVATTAETTKCHTSEATVIIYVGDERKEIQQSSFLRFVWTNGLDSPCMVCNEPFNEMEDLPIRTLTFQPNHTLNSDSQDITQGLIAPHPLRITNRHLECIKTNNITYIPISHVWHGPVSSSQQDRTETLEAAKLVYQIPVKTLNGLGNKFWSGEIWHDYLSVPQWHNEFRQRLLLAIPKIFGYPNAMAIHLDGVNKTQFLNLRQNRTYHSFLDGLRAFLNAPWFNRIWVAFQYIQGHDVLLMCEDFTTALILALDLQRNTVKTIQDYESKFGQDTFWRDVGGNGLLHSRVSLWSDMEVWKQHAKRRTFSVAIRLLSGQEAWDAHEIFWAFSGLLGFAQNSTQVAQVLAGDTFSLYLATAQYALGNGDYSPLLLIPPKGEFTIERAAWLHGHSGRPNNLGKLGMCLKQANHQAIMQGEIVSPKLELVGTIESFKYSDLSYENRTSEFLGIAQDIFRCSGLCPKAFSASIDRIFPPCVSIGRYRLTGTPEVQAEEGSDYDYERVAAGIKQVDLLTEDGSRDDDEQALGAAAELIDSLGLQTSQECIRMCRLQQAFDGAEWFKSNGYNQMECLARVRCKPCGRRSLFRLSAWETPVAEETQVFRIPGLLYDLTVPEGVGIVVCGKRIIGRMIYGTPACGCHLMKEIQIQ